MPSRFSPAPDEANRGSAQPFFHLWREGTTRRQPGSPHGGAASGPRRRLPTAPESASQRSCRGDARNARTRSGHSRSSGAVPQPSRAGSGGGERAGSPNGLPWQPALRLATAAPRSAPRTAGPARRRICRRGCWPHWASAPCPRSHGEARQRPTMNASSETATRHPGTDWDPAEELLLLVMVNDRLASSASKPRSNSAAGSVHWLAAAASVPSAAMRACSLGRSSSAARRPAGGARPGARPRNRSPARSPPPPAASRRRPAARSGSDFRRFPHHLVHASHTLPTGK